LRIYDLDSQSPAALRLQLRWLRAIRHDTDLVVPDPVADMNGDYVTPLRLDSSVQGSWCTLTRWVPGRRYFRRDGPSIETLRQVGRFMAQLHLHGIQFDRREQTACP